VLVGDIISCVGSSEVSYDGSMQLDIKVAALLSEARARGEPFITIRFNGGTKSADFKIKSRLSAAVAQEKLHTLRCKQAVVRSPAEDNTAHPPPACGVVPFYREVVESVVEAPRFTCYSEEVRQLPSPAERMRQDIAQGMSAEEQRQQERQNARVEAAADAAAATAIAAKNLEAKLTKLATTSPDVAI
jgi:ubiquinone biosynthesis protein UbiJ